MSDIGKRTNGVKGCPGWTYGLFIRHHDEDGLDYYTFDLYGSDLSGPDRVHIPNLTSSIYRTTRLARKMGDKKRRGYQYVARLAIADLTRKRTQAFMDRYL